MSYESLNSWNWILCMW